MIGYLEPHDRPETIALARRARGRARTCSAEHGGLELNEMDVDARHPARAGARADRRARAHERARDAEREALPGHRRGPRRRHRRHLDRERPAPREPQRRGRRAHGRARARDVPRPDPRGGGRGRARRPHARGAAAAAARREGLLRPTGPRRRCTTSSASRTSRRCASSRCARSPRTSSRGGRTLVLDPLSQQAVAERVLALVDAASRARSGILRRAWRSAERLGAQIDALWVRRSGHDADRRGAGRRSRPCAGSRSSSAATSSRRRGTTSSRPCAASSYERGSTYVFVGTPDESRRREILRGSLVSALVRELPGIDIRVVANRADRPEPEER